MNLQSRIVWIVLFESAPANLDDVPVVSFLPGTPFLHGLDNDLAPALQPLWACLHLPRAFSDCYDTSYSVLLRSEALDIPHDVLLLPLGVLRAVPGFRAPKNVMLVLCPAGVTAEVETLAADWGSELGVRGFDSLDQDALDHCWHRVGELVGARALRRHGPPLTSMGAGSVERLALLHRIRHYCPPDKRADIGCPPVRDELIREALGAARHAAAVAALEAAQCPPEEFGERYPDAVSAATPRWALALGSAGASGATLKAARSAANNPPAGFQAAPIADERRALEIMVAHRAISRGGFGMVFPDVPASAFTQLGQIEDAMSARRIRPWSVRKALARIGRMLGESLSTDQVSALRSSRSVTVFSDFPWGLAVLPGDTSPLATCVPVAYRPLTPMTRALQFELSPPAAVYLAEGISVLIAECIEAHDPLRAQSERAWRDQAERLRTTGVGRVACEFRVVSNLADLHAALGERSYDVLVVSAHGIRRGGLAGLRVGADDVFDLGKRVPPVVMLSACAVWPRASGAISVADLALRRGALAIIGTLAPIHAGHNEFVATRIFLYMIESLLGREPETTLAEVVHRALSSNALLDAVHGSKRVRRWAFHRGSKAHSPIEEFMSVRATGRLRAGHVYADTETVLAEIADDEGQQRGESLRQFFRSGSYVPESLLYVTLGWPEKIVLRPRAPNEAKVRGRHASGGRP